ncbi:hypothetical protein FE257_007787 [Aspergillus nanangensis]|uniref:Uncharacterized protein n=1 Tax=Aspergillus nanangensis TaxID=2582783 RepID=A0AAD4GXX2_ASPNN|nr:hypothetical protein FE257_007787 [Aspergillus nanangensis]
MKFIVTLLSLLAFIFALGVEGAALASPNDPEHVSLVTNITAASSVEAISEDSTRRKKPRCYHGEQYELASALFIGSTLGNILYNHATVNARRDSDAANLCDVPDMGDANMQELSTQRNVSGYLDWFMADHLRNSPDSSDIYNWQWRLIDYDQRCETSSNSTSVANYWAQFVTTNYMSLLKTFDESFGDFPSTSSVGEDLGMPNTTEFTYGMFRMAMGRAMSRTAWVAGSAGKGNMQTTFAAVFGSLFSLFESVQTPPYNNGSMYMSQGVSYMSLNVPASIESWREDFANTPSLSILGLTDGNYTSPIANFFDGRFMYVAQGSQIKALGNSLGESFSQGLVSLALGATDYHVFRDSTSAEECTETASGTSINGTCYRLAKGEGSDKIEEDMLKTVTDRYKVNLTEVYQSSVDCVNSTAMKNDTLSRNETVANLFTDPVLLPPCYYNLPVCDSNGCNGGVAEVNASVRNIPGLGVLTLFLAIMVYSLLS